MTTNHVIDAFIKYNLLVFQDLNKIVKGDDLEQGKLVLEVFKLLQQSASINDRVFSLLDQLRMKQD